MRLLARITNCPSSESQDGSCFNGGNLRNALPWLHRLFLPPQASRLLAHAGGLCLYSRELNSPDIYARCLWIKQEALHLVRKRVISRHQPIYTLCQYIPAREWTYFETELEQYDFLLRDRIGDLIGREEWDND